MTDLVAKRRRDPCHHEAQRQHQRGAEDGDCDSAPAELQISPCREQHAISLCDRERWVHDGTHELACL